MNSVTTSAPDERTPVKIISGAEVAEHLTAEKIMTLSSLLVDSIRDKPDIALEALRYKIATQIYRLTEGQGGILLDLVYPYTTDAQASDMFSEDVRTMAEKGSLSAAITPEKEIVGIAGYGQVSVTKDGRELPVVEMKRLVVDPLFQKRGIGTELMDTVLQRIKQTGPASIIGATRAKGVIKWLTDNQFTDMSGEDFWLGAKNYNKGKKGLAWTNLDERIRKWGWKYFRLDHAPVDSMLTGPHSFPPASDRTPMVRGPVGESIDDTTL